MQQTIDVRCPNCKQSQKYLVGKMSPKRRIKRCVYCGKSFSAEKNLA